MSNSQATADPIHIDVVRVFTDDAGAFGNELGIIESAENTRGREQAIAARLGFSETVFIEPILDAGAGARTATIRIFTPTGELPFAGHPSVGTAWWLAHTGTPVAVLREKAGDVVVRYDGDLTWITGQASWAPVFDWMPLRTPADVDALDPAAVTSGHFYAWAWIDEPSGTIRSRMFAPSMGIIEDEATGAASVRITVDLGRDLDIHQGRGSRIITRLGAGEQVQVGGRTVFDRSITLD
jgi:predicted PhzF superfamily epimerase YddE/YHI9